METALKICNKGLDYLRINNKHIMKRELFNRI